MNKLNTYILYKGTIIYYFGDNINNNDDDYDECFNNRLRRQYNYGFSIYDIHYDYYGKISNNLMNNDFYNKIFDAIKNDNFSFFSEVCLNINPFIKNNENLSVLDIILEKKLENYLKILIENGLNINLFNENNKPAISNIVINGNLEALKLILKYGGNINKTCFDRKTPLYYAVLNNHYEIVSYLIENGAFINKKALNNKTPHVIALEKNDLKLIKLLINNEYNREIMFKKSCEYGFQESLLTLLKNIEYNNDILLVCAEVCIIFNNLECLKILFEYIVNINDFISYINDFRNNGRIKMNKVLLHSACETNDEIFLKYLLDNGGDKYFKNERGESILDYAIKLNKSKHIKILKDYGVL
jgi:ankyrin repeat protein